MKHKKLIAILLAAIFLLGVVVPAIADDGRYRRIDEMKVKDHPWQDDNSNGSVKPLKRPLGFVIGSFTLTINIAIPFIEKPSQAKLLMPANNTTTQKYTEKRK